MHRADGRTVIETRLVDCGLEEVQSVFVGC